MADYKRLVSYMYLYEEGKKKNNIGYARVETRNGQCKFTIHITAQGLNERQLKAYIFRRNSSGMEGILLGTLLIRNNTGDFKVIADASHIMNSPYGLDDMGGIVLLFSEHKFFATEWDSRPITMSMVANIGRKTEENKPSKGSGQSGERQSSEGDKSVIENRTAEKEQDKETKEQEEIKAAGLAEALFEHAKASKGGVLQEERAEEIKGDKALKDLLTPNLNIVIDGETEESSPFQDVSKFADTPVTPKEEPQVLKAVPETYPEKSEKSSVQGPQDSVPEAAPEANAGVYKKESPETAERVNPEVLQKPTEAGSPEAAQEAKAGVYKKESSETAERVNPEILQKPTETVSPEIPQKETAEINPEVLQRPTPEAVQEPAREAGPEVSPEPITEVSPEPSPEPTLSQKAEQAPAGGSPAKEGIPGSSPVFDDHPLAKQIYHNFPKMYPFEDNEIAWCARIEPKDIGMLPMDLWGLGNNSFLLHGYYSYRHLIFARVNDKNGQNYILGVPGIYHNREKFMAKMFGFENFKCAKRKPQRTGEFGYWYIPVLLNRQV